MVRLIDGGRARPYLRGLVIPLQLATLQPVPARPRMTEEPYRLAVHTSRSSHTASQSTHALEPYRLTVHVHAARAIPPDSLHAPLRSQAWYRIAHVVLALRDEHLRDGRQAHPLLHVGLLYLPRR